MSYDIEKVTPRPWGVGGDGGDVFEGIPNGYHVADFQEEGGLLGLTVTEAANAAHVVHCVNHHEELVAMLEEAIDWLDEAVTMEGGSPVVWPEARALLAKVKP